METFSFSLLQHLSQHCCSCALRLLLNNRKLGEAQLPATLHLTTKKATKWVTGWVAIPHGYTEESNHSHLQEEEEWWHKTSSWTSKLINFLLLEFFIYYSWIALKYRHLKLWIIGGILFYLAIQLKSLRNVYQILLYIFNYKYWLDLCNAGSNWTDLEGII